MNELEKERLIEESDKLEDGFIMKTISEMIKMYDPFIGSNQTDLKIMINLQRQVIDLKNQLNEIKKSNDYEDRELLVAVKTIIKHIKQSE